MDDRYRYFLWELGDFLKESALEAKQAKQKAAAKGRNHSDYIFAEGRLQSYYEVISAMIGRAEGFDISPEDLHLDGLNPDRDLI